MQSDVSIECMKTYGIFGGFSRGLELFDAFLLLFKLFCVLGQFLSEHLPEFG